MNCQNLKLKYDILLAKSEEFSHVNKVFQQMKDKTQYTHAQRREVSDQLLKLQNEIQNLISTEFSHLLDYKFNETQKTLKEQYNSIKNIFTNNNLITEKGIRNPFPDLIKETQEYFPFPTEQQIRTELTKSENKELYELKIKQGFTRIQITPIISLKQQVDALAKVTLKHKDNLFPAKNNPNETTTKLTVDENEPVLIWTDGYGDNNDADLSGDIIYYPKDFHSENHQGLIKKELLLQSLKTPFPGYIIELKQENPLIPRENQAETIHNRKSLTANKSSKDCLEEIQIKPEYQGENLVTIDSEIISTIISLEENNGVLHDYNNPHDSACLAAGTYLKHHGAVPFLFWYRGFRRFSMHGDGSVSSNSDVGVVSSVRL